MTFGRGTRRETAASPAPADVVAAEANPGAQTGSSEARLRAVLDAALDAVIAIDSTDVITFWNPRAEAIFGWGRDEAIGRRLADLVIPERFRESHRRGIEQFLASGIGPLLGRRVELNGLRRDGTEFPAELSITAVKDGGSYSFSAFVADITERKLAETDRRLSADVFRNMQVGLNVWCLEDRDDLRSFKLVSSNPAAAHSLGVRSEDIIGKRMDQAFPHMLETDLPQQYHAVVASGVGRDLGVVREIVGEGDEAVFAVKVFPLPGDCVGVVFENMTAREQLEAQPFQSQKMEAVGRLAAGVNHVIAHSGVLESGTRLIEKPFTARAFLGRVRMALGGAASGGEV